MQHKAGDCQAHAWEEPQEAHLLHCTNTMATSPSRRPYYRVHGAPSDAPARRRFRSTVARPHHDNTILSGAAFCRLTKSHNSLLLPSPGPTKLLCATCHMPAPHAQPHPIPHTCHHSPHHCNSTSGTDTAQPCHDSITHRCCLPQAAASRSLLSHSTTGTSLLLSWVNFSLMTHRWGLRVSLLFGCPVLLETCVLC
jgi:hypothetical protein